MHRTPNVKQQRASTLDRRAIAALSMASVELSDSPVLWFGNDGPVLFANAAAVDLLGYSPIELMDLSADDLGLSALFATCPTGEGASRPEVLSLHDISCRCKDGQSLPVSVFSRRVATAEGEYILASVRVHPVSVDEPLRQSEHIESDLAKIRLMKRQYLALSENSTDLIFRVDRAKRHLYVNRAIKQFVELSPVDLLGKSYGEIGFDRSFSNFMDERLEWVFQNNAPCEQEISFQSAKGDFILNLRLFPEHDETLRVVTVLGVGRDITGHRKTERNYAALFERMIDGFALHEIICDLQGVPVDYRFISVNPAFESLTGIPAAKIVGKTVLEVMPNTEPYWIETYGRVALTGEEVSCVNFSREIGRYFEVKAYRPAPGQFACIFIDVTEQKLAEQAHRQAEAKFRSAFYDAGFGMVIVGLDGSLLEVNSTYCSLLGYSRAELLGMSFVEFTHPDDLPHQREKIEQLLSGEVHNYQIEKRYRHRDGHIFWVMLSISLVRGDDGLPDYFIGQIQDIDERKRAESALRESEERFRLLLNSTAEAIYGLNNVGNCVFCNTSCIELLGFHDESELLGKNMHALIHHSHSDGHPYSDEDCPVFRSFLAKENVHIEDEVFWRADGSSFDAEYWAYPVIKDGHVVGAVVTFLDITERKRLQAQAFRNSQLASLGELAAGVAHEINNPINGVINYAQYLLNRGVFPAQECDVLHKIIKEGSRVAVIVRNLLSIAHNGLADKGYHGPAEILEEVLSVVRTQLDKDGTTLLLDLDEDLPAILCSKQQIEQVVLNLVNNSRHALNEKYACAHPDKLIKISARLAVAEGRHYVRFEFVDQGTGIPRELLGRVLNPFVTTKPAGIGTGLGLTICHDLIYKHNGRLAVDSRCGEFTRVTVDLPIRD